MEIKSNESKYFTQKVVISFFFWAAKKEIKEKMKGKLISHLHIAGLILTIRCLL